MGSSLFNLNRNKPKPQLTNRPVRKPMTTMNISTKLEMTGGEFQEFRTYIYDKCGIYFTDSKKYLLEGRITKRLIALKLNSFRDYITLLKKDIKRLELDNLFESITINETFFYRAIHQFEAVENILIPELIKKKIAAGQARPTIRLWSAASSSGEESYTLALIIHDRLKRKYPNVTFQILASDIDQKVIQNAKLGVYKQYAIRNIPPDQLRRYFDKKENEFHLKNEIKKYVKFTQINLFDTIAMRKIVNCDIVFCANVLIYFDVQAKQKVVSHLYSSLNKGGYLFIGYSESLHGISKAFKLIHLPKAMTYFKD